MNHVTQRNKYDCGICVAAMLTRQSYETVLTFAQAHTAYSPGHGLSALGLANLTKALTQNAANWQRVKPAKLGPLALARHGTFAALVVRVGEPRKAGHWIVYHYGHVYDPALPYAETLKSYLRKRPEYDGPDYEIEWLVVLQP